MKAGRIIEMGEPGKLYSHPKNAYVASLFGEVNEIPASLFFKEQPARKKVILYPHEVQHVEEGNFKASVKRSFFKGSHYLIEVALQGHDILMNSPKNLPQNKTISLSFNDELLKQRLR